MKKNVYMVQAGCLYGNTYYLPYAAGILIAFAKSNEKINEIYDFKRIIYSLEDVDESINSLENPAYVGFSNSIWNYNYNLVYAEKLKQKYPDCIIEFGGHHVPPSTEFLDKYDFIDILIHRKGEEAYRDVLLALANGTDLADIPNISYRDASGAPVQTEEVQTTIADLPSPYLTGVFDEIIANGKYPFSCVLETNRGCPYSCSYCDWGELKTKVRLFPLEKVMAELDWMSEHKMEFVYCIDSNFGMFERDELVAQKLVDLKESTGYPNRLQVSYAKNETERVFSINKLLADHGIGKGATLSMQSLNPHVLENIGRVNISKEKYSEQIKRYRDAGISTYTELILGLPGETLESFCQGLCETLELGQHSSVSAYYCELLPNSEMAQKPYLDKYKIKTVSTSLNQYHCESMDDVLSGHSSIVVGTDTLSVEDWVKANEFSICVQSFHHFGILQCFAMYIRKELDISYFDFYSALYEFITKESTFLKNIFDIAQRTLQNFVDGKGGLTYQNDIFGKITYPLEEAVFLLCLYDKDVFYKEVTPFLRRYISDTALLEDLLSYQDAVVLNPGKADFKRTFDYSFKDYFDAILRNSYTPLSKESIEYHFTSPFNENNWVDYAKEIIWYGRRNNRMMFYSKPNSITSE